MADKKIKAAKPSTLTPEALRSELLKINGEQTKLHFQHNVAPLKNPSELRRLRREVARIKTALRAKETNS